MRWRWGRKLEKKRHAFRRRSKRRARFGIGMGAKLARSVVEDRRSRFRRMSAKTGWAKPVLKFWRIPLFP